MYSLPPPNTLTSTKKGKNLTFLKKVKFLTIFFNNLIIPPLMKKGYTPLILFYYIIYYFVKNKIKHKVIINNLNIFDFQSNVQN